MAKYPVSGSVTFLPGNASSAADNASTGAALLVHGTATGTLSSRNKIFYLRSAWFKPVASGMTFGLSDACYSATNAGVVPQLKFLINCASYVEGSDASNLGFAAGMRKVDFPAPGLKFTTNCLVLVVTGSGATTGSCGGLGYEEG